MKIYIGHDSREPEASRVALASLRRVSGSAHSVEFLDLAKLVPQGLYWRPIAKRAGGQLWDEISDAPMSTEFAISRFLVPIISRGIALFVDADVVFREDPVCMMPALRNTGAALAVVKHDHQPATALKMDGQQQTRYWRKNWSSVMLFDCDHAAHRRLTLQDVNSRPGRALHQFCWLDDGDIAALDPRWNWLVGEQPPTAAGGIAHFTVGGPFTPGWQGGPHDAIWDEAASWGR
jgi:hypothetical protein